jgi:hypothetical protein
MFLSRKACWVKTTRTRPRITVTGGGRGVVSHAGARLLADLADATGLTSAFSQGLAGLRQRQGGHDPGRIAVDLAVMLADGGQAIADLGVLRDQSGLFGPVASDPTAWRLLSQLDETMLAELRAARADARQVAWAQHAETRGPLQQPAVAGQPVDGLVLDIDATIVICHSEKEAATSTWKKTFGYHPLLCFLDNTGEALAGLLREGRAGSNTTADHITVLDQALAQVPDEHRHGASLLLRSDSAGSSHGFLAHIRALRTQQHLDIRFSVGAAITEPVREAIRAATGWIPAIDTDGDLREHAEVCEITGLLDAAGWPDGTRFLVRRNARTLAPNCRCSTPSRAGGTRWSPPTPRPATDPSNTWRPATGHTPGSRTASAPEKTPASAGSHHGCSRSTRPGCNLP